MTKDPNKNANDMGGPSFHPDIADKEKTAARDTMDKKQVSGTQILDEDQVPPL